MKNGLVLLVGLAIGCEEMTYPHGRCHVSREGDGYVSDNGGRTYIPRGMTSAYRRMQREIEASSMESLRQRQIENDIRNGFLKSGYDDIDETIIASNRLAYGHKSFWSKKRIKDHGEADALWELQKDKDDDGPSEERMGASDSKSPAWVGKPLGVPAEGRKSGMSTGKALDRFFFGTEREEDNDL